MDDEHFLEAIGKTGVFVNQRQVMCVMLKECDVITITTKALALCKQLPKHAGPLLSYNYSHVRHNVQDLENAYSSTISPSDLITLSDEVNGRVLNETYHVEDFNCTPQVVPAEIIHTCRAANHYDFCRIITIFCFSLRPYSEILQ